MASIDPYLINFVLLSFVALVIGIFLRHLKQPIVIGYIITGVVVGPYGFGLVKNQDIISALGSIGVILLLFFVGIEFPLSRIMEHWKIAIIGTLLQIILSLGIVFIFGNFFDWPRATIILIGFVISLSSTAVVLKILENMKILYTKLGRDTLSILLMQDLAIAPMLIILTSIDKSLKINDFILQLLGISLIAGFIFWLLKKKEIRLPFKDKLKADHEFQLLGAFILCFGFAFITGLLQLSTALGAFLAGIFIATTKDTQWVHEHLTSFKTLLVAFFFVSIGMLIDISFLMKNYMLIAWLVLILFLVKTLVNAFIFHWFKESWRCSFYAGALLSQIGEFSFLLAAAGFSSNIISSFGYHLTIAVISISMLLSPFWIALFSRLVRNYLKTPGVCLDRCFCEMKGEKGVRD